MWNTSDQEKVKKNKNKEWRNIQGVFESCAEI
jgi:hypothetical protein